MPIYMKIEGITGPVKSGDYRGWFELQSAQFGVSRHVTNSTGQGANREAAHPAITEIVVTRELDEASTLLVQEALWGDGKKVTIDFVREAGSAYLEFEMENTLISNYSVSGHGGVANSKPLETLSLNFTEITQKSVAKTTPGKLK